MSNTLQERVRVFRNCFFNGHFYDVNFILQNYVSLGHCGSVD